MLADAQAAITTASGDANTVAGLILGVIAIGLAVSVIGGLMKKA